MARIGCAEQFRGAAFVEPEEHFVGARMLRQFFRELVCRRLGLRGRVGQRRGEPAPRRLGRGRSGRRGAGVRAASRGIRAP